MNDTPIILPLRLLNLKFTPDALLGQPVAQFRPTVTTGQGRFDGIIDLVFHIVLAAQTVTFHIHLAFGEMQVVFPRESLAHHHVAYGIDPIADGVSVIVNPVGHDVQVLVFPVGVTAYNVLSVHNSHALHVLTGDFCHQSIRQLGRVLVGEVQRSVVCRIFQPAPRLVISLSLHTSCNGCVAIKMHILVVDKSRFFRVVHVVHQLGEARPFLQVAHHILSMILLDSSSKSVIFPLVLGKPC